MHILFILDYFHPYIGGIETLFDDVTDFCIKKGYTVTVLTSRHDASLSAIEKRKGVHIYRTGKNRFTILWKALRFGITHRGLFQSIDHIHTSTFTAAIPAWILSKLYKKPCTITIHEIYDILRHHLKGKKAILYIRFEKFILGLDWTHIVTVSSYTKSMIQKLYHLSDKSLSVIYNQVDNHFWSRNTVSDKEIQTLKKEYNLTNKKIGLFVGRLGYEKGLPYLIESLHDVTAIYHDFVLVIIAPKTLDLYPKHIQHQIKTTKDQITNNDLNKHILWIDPVKDDTTLKLWMITSDIGIIPSMSEGFCYTAVQMQALGLPLIVSDVGALPEVLSQKHTFVGYGKIKELSTAIQSNLLAKTEKEYLTTSSDIININYQQYCDMFEKYHK